MSDVETPTTVEERVRTSVRLDSIDHRLGHLEQLHATSNERLGQLVDYARARDEHETDQLRWEREQALTRQAWWQSLITSGTAKQIATAIATAITTYAAIWASQQAPSLAAGLPASDEWGAEAGPTDGSL